MAKIRSARNVRDMGRAYRDWLSRFIVLVRVCFCSSCLSKGAREIHKGFEDLAERHGVRNDIAVIPAGNLGPCSEGPLAVLEPPGILYWKLDQASLEEIFLEHILQDRPLQKRMFRSGKGPVHPDFRELPFFREQRPDTLGSPARIDPTSIESYIGTQGYEGLAEILERGDQKAVISMIQKSGLRGRGGAGFPTGEKWQACRDARSLEKFVVCNADEGDPGSTAQRTLLESNPHAVIEGMIAGAFAVGATQGFLFTRGDYAVPLQRIHAALNQARLRGLLGRNILGRDFDFDIKVVLNPGGLVGGESTAVTATLEGRVGEPRPAPFHCTEEGIWGRPTLLNNVETWATVPRILRCGPKRFRSTGTEDSPGTKLLSPSGNLSQTGVIEVPLGMELRRIVEEICGGVPKPRKLKAVQAGGPAGGFIPERLLDTRLGYEELQSAGAMMCTGSLIVLDDTVCIVEQTRSSIEFLLEESCGQCSPCRDGLSCLLDILTRICEGQGEMDDLDRLSELTELIEASSLCHLGRSAANPLRSGLRHFFGEYISHIEEKKCPAGVCPGLTKFSIDRDLCVGCGKCLKACPAGAITGERKKPHKIDTSRCIVCGACRRICPKGAVTVLGPMVTLVQKPLLR